MFLIAPFVMTTVGFGAKTAGHNIKLHAQEVPADSASMISVQPPQRRCWRGKSRGV